MDKSKSLEKLLKMVLMKKYPEIEDIIIDLYGDVFRFKDDPTTYHTYNSYEVGVKLGDNIMSWSDIENDILELSKMILTGQNEHTTNIYML